MREKSEAWKAIKTVGDLTPELEELIRNLYVRDKKSISAVSYRADIRMPVVTDYLRKHGLTRSSRECGKMSSWVGEGDASREKHYAKLAGRC